MKNKLLFYPANLSIIEIINNDLILTDKQKEIFTKYYQRVLYPVSRIILEYKLNKSFSDEKITDVYVPLSSKILQKDIFGKPFRNINNKINNTTTNSLYSYVMPFLENIDVKKEKVNIVIDFLLRNDIIVRNPNRKYKPGEKSYEYRLSNKYIQDHYSKEKIKDQTLLNNLLNNTNMDNNDPLFIHLKNNLVEIKIDIDKALNKLNNKINNTITTNSLYSYVGPFFNSVDFIETYFNELRCLDIVKDDNDKKEIIENWYINISKILEEDFFMNRGENSGRIFTNLTSIPRELRECIYINNTNDRLCEIDIANSQPFLFNKCLLNNFNLDDELFNEYEDVRKYMKQTSGGTLYNDLMDIWKYDGDRHLFKKVFFGSIFYCKTTSNFRNKYSIEFAKLYPNVMDLIIRMKEGNYKNIALQLQKIESDIIIYKVSKRLLEQTPDIWFATIHDSVMCYEKDCEYVKEIMKQEFNKQSLFPTLKIKKYKD